MKITSKNFDSKTIKTQSWIIPVINDNKLLRAGKSLDTMSQHHLTKLLKLGDLPLQVGSTLVTYVPLNGEETRIILVQVGDPTKLTPMGFMRLVTEVAKTLKVLAIKSTFSVLNEIPVPERSGLWKLEQEILTVREAWYQIPQTGKAEPKAYSLEQYTLMNPAKETPKSIESTLTQAIATANGTDLTRDLGNAPPNICTPSYLANQAKSLGKEWKLKVDVLERAQLEKLGMGAFLAVTAGSHEPPKLIVAHYNNAPKGTKPIILVGKGITFDTGGVSLKPGLDMDEMKFDMCGAASVLGTLRALAEMKLPLHVIGIIPTCENMPDGKAARPGDVVTSLSGQTIEILNTDAEGRLILCDALTYAKRFEPETIIDVATLTGACVIALGHEAAGLYAHQLPLRLALEKAGEYSNDRVWPMPLWEDYQTSLKSRFADMGNIGGRAGGSITAACFLSRFTTGMNWAHLDIAGVANKSGPEKGATGRPVRLFCRYLIEQSQ